MNILKFILCWASFGFIGFMLAQIHIVDEETVFMIDEEDKVSDFMASIVMGFLYFISVAIIIIGNYIPKFITPFVMWLMKIVQKIRRR